MRFRDRKHQLQVQQAERKPAAQQVIAEFCRLINFPYQQQQGLFAVGYYTAVLPDLSVRQRAAATAEPFGGAAAAAAGAAPFGTSFRPVEEALAEEAAAEEAPVEAEAYTEEVAATAVDLADEQVEEQVEESDLATEDLPAEELSASDNGASETLDEAPEPEGTEAIDRAVGRRGARRDPPPAPVPVAHPGPAAAPAPARADGRDRTPVAPRAPPPPVAQLARGLERRLHRPARDGRPGPRTPGATGDSAGREADHACRSRARQRRGDPAQAARSSGHSEPGRRALGDASR